MVSLKLPMLLPYAELFYISDGKEEFLKNAEIALAENNRDLVKRKVELVRANGWNGKLDEI